LCTEHSRSTEWQASLFRVRENKTQQWDTNVLRAETGPLRNGFLYVEGQLGSSVDLKSPVRPHVWPTAAVNSWLLCSEWMS
jgi:hypothetical protein